ncbi:MAE_28990/MAE_18760 family HEPN-like nuclease [Pseudoalteromonas apostichopi]|uniref:MAE_28990/MAE_18760 family HEPN-like nuclease n=1 Tax=Pseudoalteromonas apostichopi TaxID=3035452 RepID=UPI0025742017|nr:MAE_28990/MAE_18760 family HEPN-like nuclease [Pseudoalteromonas sp. FE4]
MHTLKDDFQEKRKEADILMNHIQDLSSEIGNVNKVAILKSAFIILLYNVVESTTVLTLERVHEKVSRYKYSELSQPLKKLFVEYYLFGENKNKQQSMLNLIMSNSLTFPGYDEFTKKVNLFSGNLDARELSKILGRYGIGKITSLNKDKLLTVKNKRNKIAHGEVMFKECCRNSTFDELKSIKIAIFDALEQMIASTEIYFNQQRYLES